MLYTLYIVNKAGGLVFNRDLSPGVPRLSTNEYLRSASTFHSLYAIASQLAPVPSSGIEKLESDTFTLECFQSPTGVKFFVTARPGTAGLAETLRRIYELYADFVLKNPFYETDMPIRCEKFDAALDKLVRVVKVPG